MRNEEENYEKKVLFLALAAAMMLTACGGKTEAESADVEADAKTEAVEEADTEEAEAVEETEEVAEEVTEEAEEAEEVVAGDYAKGVVTETGWESEWLGIRYTAPEGMTMSTEEELNEVMGLGQEMLSEDYSELQLKYAELTSVYEMMSTDETGATNVLVTAEKLIMSMTAEQYVEALIQGLEGVSVAQYNVLSSDEVVTIGNVDFIKVVCEADYQGVKLYQDYYVTVSGNRAVSIAISYADATVETAEAAFNAFGAY